MTHNELLLKIDAEIEYNLNQGGVETGLGDALRAVVELHKPTPLDERGDVCLTCCPDLLTLYPCSTIQIIEKELQ